MKPFSREAAAAYAEHEIQQRRIERIKAVRNKEKKLAKQQTVQYAELHQSAQKQIEEELQKKWQTQRNQRLHKLKTHYNKLQSSIGIAHKSAHKTTQAMNAIAITNKQKLNHQKLISTQRARTAVSKLQQKIINEQNEREIRAKWRHDAIKLAEIHRNRLQKQLQHQYIILPPGLSPQNPRHNNNHNRKTRYTLVTSHSDPHRKANVDYTKFNPHPMVYLKHIEEHQAPNINDETEHSKIYNLRQYLPPKLLKKLNKKYSKKGKKHKRRTKQEKKFKAAGITLKSDGNQMLSIPEDKTLSEQSMFHSIPSHIQQRKRIKCVNNTVNTVNPWDKAKQIREQTAEKERKQTQQFLKAQKRGKIALEKEIQKTMSKQLDQELELIHQKLIQEKLEKCQKIIESTNKSNNSTNKLQEELEEKFEDLFQIHSKSKMLDEIKEENIQIIQNVENTQNKEDEESKMIDNDMKPRLNLPQPQSYSSSQSLSPQPAPTRNVPSNYKKKLQVQSRRCLQPVPVQPPSVALPIPVSIPCVKRCDIVIPNDIKECNDQTFNESVHIESPCSSARKAGNKKEESENGNDIQIEESENDIQIETSENENAIQFEESESQSDDADDDDESSLSVTRSRRVKIQRNNDGSTSISESTSIASSVYGSPQSVNTNHNNEQVIVPKKWFESLLRQIKNDDNHLIESQISSKSSLNSSISSQTVNLQNMNIIDHGEDHALQDANKKKENDINIPSTQQNRESVHLKESLSRLSNTNSIQSNSNIHSPSNRDKESNDDEYNLIFKRKKPISVLSEMLSDIDPNDADDEYDPNQKPNNLRQSFDSDLSNLDNESTSSLSIVNLDNAHQFIRESAALLNQTANFFENFSDGSSMDYTKTDKSIKKGEIDNLLRSSIQSDSSNWSLSSLSSMEFNNLPSSLQKFDHFLSETKSKNTDNKNTKKMPMQTIKEIPTPSSSTTFTLRSDIDDDDNDSWRDKPPNTPKPFGIGSSIIYNANDTKNVIIESNSNLDYHSEEEKASSLDTKIKKTDQDVKVTKQHFITPTNTVTTSKTRSINPSNPRFTDGTINSYPSLPPSNRGSVLKHHQKDQSLLPIEHLDFMDIPVSNSNSNAEDEPVSNTESDQSSISLNDLKKFNNEMNDTLKQILKLKINSDDTVNDNESFLHSIQEKEHKNVNVLDSINVSEIEMSKSSEHIGDMMTNLSTSSFSLSTFNMDAKEKRMTDGVKKGRFPPLTPQDLEGGRHSYLNKRIEIDDTEDDDMELDDHTQNPLQRQNAEYFDEEDDTTQINNKGCYQSFRFKYDSIHSLDDDMIKSGVNDYSDIMCVGDLEMIKEEVISESNNNYTEFIGIESEKTQSTVSDESSNKSNQQIDIGRKLEKLKLREKKKKYGQINKDKAQNS